jgi:hypothetical protein
MSVGERLGLPTLATISNDVPGPRAAELWAVRATLLGARIVAWGGLDQRAAILSVPALKRHGALVAEIRQTAAANLESRASGWVLVAPAGPDGPQGQDESAERRGGTGRPVAMSREQQRSLRQALEEAAERQGFADLPPAGSAGP